MTETETAWLAGILEGEGCFDANTSGRAPRIRLEMTDEDVVQRVADLVGGNVREVSRRTASNKSVYLLSLGTKAGAAEVMRLVRPWMSKRRQEKIDSILDAGQEDVL